MDPSESPERLRERITSFDSALSEMQRGGQLHLLDAATISRLDEAVTSLRFTLRSSRNSLRPIYRLSPEVLAIIFRHLLEESVPSFPDSMQDGPVRRSLCKTCDKPSPEFVQTLTSLMRVCRRWRDTLLTFRSLWSIIILPTVSNDTDEMSKNLEICLKMSGSVPLHVYANLPAKSTIPSCIAEHASRLKVLNLKFRGDAPLTGVELSWERQQMDVFQSRAAPILECLTIDGYQAGFLPWLFSGHCPSLRRLALLGVNSWQRGNFTTLTHLTINSQGYGSGQPDEIMDILHANPYLKEVNLYGMDKWFDAHRFDPASAHITITLDHLEKLSLAGFCTPEQAQILLACLKLPPSTSLNLDFSVIMFPPPIRHDIFTFLPPDTSRLENIQQITTLAIHITSHQYQMAQVVALGPHAGLYSQCFYATDYDEDAEVDEVALDGNPEATFYRSSFSHLSQLPFLAQIQELWLSRDAGEVLNSKLSIPSPTYRALFQGATSLLTLHLCAPGELHLIEGLLSDGETAPPCQGLETLVIHDSSSLSRDTLLLTVKQRKESGCALRKLCGKLIDGDPSDETNELYLEEVKRYVEIVDPRLDPVPKIEVPAKWGAEQHTYWEAWQLGDHLRFY